MSAVTANSLRSLLDKGDSHPLSGNKQHPYHNLFDISPTTRQQSSPQHTERVLGDHNVHVSSLLSYSNCLFAESFVVNAGGGWPTIVCVVTVSATQDDITKGSLVLDIIWDAKNT